MNTPTDPDPDPDRSHPPATHAEALRWCADLHPEAHIPEDGCGGTLRRAGAFASSQFGLAEGAEAVILICDRCGVELAIGRGTNPLARELAPGLHGLLLWIDRAGTRGFDYEAPGLAGLDRAPAMEPGPEPGPAPAYHLLLTEAEAADLAMTLEDLRRLRSDLDDLAVELHDVAGRHAAALDRLEQRFGLGKPG